MSRRASAEGPDLVTALTRAVSDVLDVDSDDVVLSLTAPGLDEVDGDVRLDLRVQSRAEGVEAQSDEPDDSRDDEPDQAGEIDPADLDEEPEQAGEIDPADLDEEPEQAGEIDPADLDEEAEAAADFVEGLLDAMELAGDIRIRISDEHAEVEVVDASGGVLIGRRGQTLEAIQELLRCALQREFERRCRVMVDVEGYRSRRLEKVLEKARESIDEVLDGGEPERLEPMDVFERKAVHQLVSSVAGVTSHSQGHEPARRVVIEAE